MILFSKEKELIFKITNAILLLWFVAAVVITLISIIDLIWKEPKLPYEDYKVVNCKWYQESAEYNEVEAEKMCKNSYQESFVGERNDDYRQIKAIFYGVVNVVVVGGVLAFMNKEKGKKK